MRNAKMSKDGPLPVPNEGFTFVELIAVITILLLLTTLAMPLARVHVEREREVELRSDLQEMRDAIDRYKEMSDKGMIPVKADAFGYPHDLQSLVDGITLRGPAKNKLKFLRKLPVDPMTGNTDWGLGPCKMILTLGVGVGKTSSMSTRRPREPAWMGRSMRIGKEQNRKPIAPGRRTGKPRIAGLLSSDSGFRRQGSRLRIPHFGLSFGTPDRRRSFAASEPGLSLPGFTLLEIMVVLVLILILASFAVPSYHTAIVHAREAVLRDDLFTMRKMIDEFTLDKQRPPASLDELVDAGYLRGGVPVDPFTQSNETWKTDAEDVPLSPDQATPGIVNVHSGSDETSLDGTPYSSW